jgi:hypothetical protein
MIPHHDVDNVADWVAETPESIAARLEGAKAAQAQIRLTMGVMAIISMMMLIAAYNAYFSYDYDWILGSTERQLAAERLQAERLSGPEAKDRKPASENVAATLTEQALKDWAESRMVQISLLGIRVSIDDVAVLGSACLFVLSLWLVLVARRENHTIGLLLQDTDTPRPSDSRDSSLVESRSQVNSSGRRWLIFHTIISNSLFVTVDHSLSTVHSLSNLKPMKAGATGAISAWLHRAGFGIVRNFFFLFPVLASFAVFCVDRRSYFIQDPFDPNFATPASSGLGPFFWESMVVFFVCWIPLTLCCLRARRYSSNTEKVLNQYGAKLRADLLRRKTFAQS